MLQNVWRQVLLQQQLQEVQLREKIQTQEILLFFLVDVQDVMVVAVLQVHLRFIQKSLQRLVELRYRKVMHLQSVRCRDFSEDQRLLSLLRNVTILVQVVYRQLSVSLQMVLQLILIRFLRSMKDLTEQNLLYLSLRNVWQLLLILQMLRSSLHMQQKRILRRQKLQQLLKKPDLYLTGEERIQLIYQELSLILTVHIRKLLYLQIYQMRRIIILRQRKLRMLRVSGLRHLQILMNVHRKDLLKDSMVQSVQAQCLCLMVVSTSLQKHRLWQRSFLFLRVSVIQLL